MRKTFIAAALGALILLPATAPAAAPSDFRSWLSREIDRNMVYPTFLLRSRETAVAIARSSGNAMLDSAALRLIASLELPASAPAGTHVAVLQYGESAGMAEDLRQSMQLREAAQQARLELNGADAPQLARTDSPLAG
jgi:hypothetical protein